MGTDIHIAVEVRPTALSQGLTEILGEASTAVMAYRPWLFLAGDGFHPEVNGGIFPTWPGHLEKEGEDQPREKFEEYWRSDPGGRNYTLFGFLANVRNGRGFAGVYIGDPMEPQFAERGLPVDIDIGSYNNDPSELFENMKAPSSDEEEELARMIQRNWHAIAKEMKAARDPRAAVVLASIVRLKEGAATPGERKAAEKAEARWRLKFLDDLESSSDDDGGWDDFKQWLGYHDFTYATYAELRDAPWGMDKVYGGYVPVHEDDKRTWGDGKILPMDWEPGDPWTGGSSGMISGPKITTYEWDTWVAAGKPRHPGVYVCIKWKEKGPLEDGAFHRWVKGPLTKVAEQYGEENVRVLMGFDS